MANANLKAALEAIGERSDEILFAAENGERPLESMFSPKENRKTIETCLALADAVAQTKASEIRTLRAEIENCRDRVMAANSAVGERLTRNPEMMSAIQSQEDFVFNMLLSGSGTIVFLAKLMRHSRWIAGKVMNGFLVDLRQQIAKSESDAPLKVQIVKPEKPRSEAKGKGEGGRGPQTPFKRTQRAAFAKFLERKPVTPSASAITRAHQCWNEHRKEWDAAAKNGTGYYDYKNLARAI